MTDSVFERLGRDGRYVEALEFLLDARVNPKKTEAIRCLDPSHHRNGDATPSGVVCPDAGCVKCSTTGKVYGLGEIGVLRNKAATVPDVAKLLEERFYGAAGNGHKPTDPDNSRQEPTTPKIGTDAWPWFPKTAEALGWEVVEDMGVPALRLPTWAPDGSKGRTKIRRKKSDGVPTAAFENDAEDCGLVNLPALLETSAGADHPSCALLCGESDLLAWTWALKGIDCPGVTSSTGEGTSLAAWAQHFKGVRVYFFPDNDDAGRKEAPKRAAELTKAGADVRVLHPPAPHKDVCDWVRSGVEVREMMRLADEAAKPPVVRFTPIGALDLLQKTLPPIEELVMPRVVYRGGVTVMVASYKRGKSLAALGLCVDLVLAVVAPESAPDESLPRWLGQMVVGRGPALVYSAEGGERMIQERLAKMIPSPDETINDLYVYAQAPAPQLDDAQQLDECFAHAERLGCVLLVFDPLGRFWAMEDEADPTTARNLMLAIQTRAEKAYGGKGIAVLVVHHDTKAGGTDADSPVTGGRGSGKFADDADALVNLKLTAGGEPGESIAKFLLRHAESPAPVPVFIDKRTLRLRERTASNSDGAPPKRSGRPPKLSLDNLEKCIRHFKRIDAAKIADQLEVSYSTWSNNRAKMIRELVELGRISVETGAKGRDILVWSGPTTETTETTESRVS